MFNDWLYHQTYYIKVDPRKNTTSLGFNWEIYDATFTQQIIPGFTPVQIFINESLTDTVEEAGFNFIPSVFDGGQSWLSFLIDPVEPSKPGEYMPESLRDYVGQVAFVSIEGDIESKAADGDNLMLLAGSLVPQ